jgi:primase-polymerase (primpol)-like protein
LYNKEYEKIKEKINHINEKYKLEDNNQSIPLNDIIEKFAYKSINDNITNTKKDKLLRIDEYKGNQKEIQKEQKTLLTKEEKQKLDDAFLELLHTYIKLLDAEGINLSGIKTPLDYNKIVKEVGNRSYKLGQKVKVVVIGTDKILRTIDFAFA